MSDLITPSNIMFALGILSAIFSVFLFFRRPQEEMKSKAELLAQAVKIESESNEKKFKEIGARMDSALTLAQNHTHSISVQVEGLTALVNEMNVTMNKEITRLATILEERFPKK